jgi:hypothetical protein
VLSQWLGAMMHRTERKSDANMDLSRGRDFGFFFFGDAGGWVMWRVPV